MRLKLVPSETNFDFFSRGALSGGFSVLMMVASVVLFFVMGLNFGIDFKGGTTLRTDASEKVDVAVYRQALEPLNLGDFSIIEVSDLTKPDQNVSQIRIEAQESGSASAELINRVEAALGSKVGGVLHVGISGNDKSFPEIAEALSSVGIPAEVSDSGVTLPTGSGYDVQLAVEENLKDFDDSAGIEFDYERISFPSVESVGPKVSGELVQTAVLAVVAAIAAVLSYIWLRFEWQFALGAVAALVHDVIITIGAFALLQIKFDLAIIAALLTIVGYSLNDTVVVFDRVRENLRKYKTRALSEVLNLSINETLSRTVMTSVTTLIALISLFVLGGDVIRGFVFAMILGVVIGTYSSVFVASAILNRLGVKRDWSKEAARKVSGQFADIDA